MKKVVGDAKPADGKVSVTLPEIAENGNTVPFSVAVDSPMTDSDHVKTVHVFATGNPRPDVASFSFSPASGKAAVSSRMRLGKTQEQVATHIGGAEYGPTPDIHALDDTGSRQHGQHAGADD